MQKLDKRQKSDFLSKKYHKGSIISGVISPDDKYFVTAGLDKCIKIWNFKTLEHVQEFENAHRGPITSLVFRKSEGELELFSASVDRSLKVIFIKF